MHSLARFAPFVIGLALLTGAPTAAQAAPAKPLPACTPAQRATWPITDRNTIVEGRTIIIHTSPDGRKRCGEVQVSTRRPRASMRRWTRSAKNAARQRESRLALA